MEVWKDGFLLNKNKYIKRDNVVEFEALADIIDDGLELHFLWTISLLTWKSENGSSINIFGEIISVI